MHLTPKWRFRTSMEQVLEHRGLHNFINRSGALKFKWFRIESLFIFVMI